MSEELKPGACPFCDSALLPFGSAFTHPSTSDCWLRAVRIDADEVAAWNRRATPPSPSTAEPLGYAMFRDGKQEGIERTKACADQWVNAVAVPLGPIQSPSTASEVGELPKQGEAHALAVAAKFEVQYDGKRGVHHYYGFIENVEDLIKRSAALASKPVAREVEGWQQVPKEPTEAMMHAAADVPAPRPYGAVYRAMLSAAPKFPAASNPAPAGAAKGGNTQPSAAEVDVEAERKLPERIQQALDLLADATLPRDTWRDVSNVLHACRDAIVRRTKEGAKEEITDAMADAGAEVLYGATRAQAVEYVKEDKFDSCANQAMAVYVAMRAATQTKEQQP